MDQPSVERRRLLQFFALGSIAVPAAALAGCAQGSGSPMTRPRRRGGGNNGGEKSGGGGGAGGGGGGGKK
jgi:hypothetical protein